LGAVAVLASPPLLDAAEHRGLDLNHFIATSDGWISEIEFGIRSTMDREESSKLSDRMLAVRQREADQGLPRRGSTRPFGYDDDCVTVRKDEAAVIGMAARKVIAGESIWSIATDLNKQGVPTVTGKPWSSTTLASLLRSPRIRGLRAHHGKIAGPAVWPAILNPEIEPELDKVLAIQRRGGRERSYLLTGKLVCGACGARMKSHNRSANVHSYACVRGPGLPGCGAVSIAAGPLEAAVKEITLGLFAHPSIVKSIERHAKELSGRSNAVSLKNLDAMRERIVDAFVSGLISKSEAAKRTRQLDEERRRAEDVKRVGSRQIKITVPTDPVALEQWWITASVAQRAELTGLVIESITVKASTRPKGSRGLDSARLVFHLADFIDAKVTKPAVRTLTK
jgi:site-specific DNA recombinase